MIKELDPTSNAGGLVDCLLEHGVSIRILAPGNREQSFGIEAEIVNTGGERARCAKRIDLNQYKCSPPELRSMIVTQTINTMVEELIYL